MADEKSYTQAELDEIVNGLRTKNSTLLGEITTLKQTVRKFDEVDVDKLIADSTKLSSLLEQQDKDKGEYKKLYEDLKKAADVDKDTLAKQLEGVKNEFNDHKKRTIIGQQLAKAKVDPIVLDITIDSIIPKATMDDDGEIFIEGKKADEYVQEWTKSDIGKKFVISGNSGGGAGGGAGGNVNNKSKYFDKKSPDYSLTEQAKIAKSDIQEYNRLRGIYGQ